MWAYTKCGRPVINCMQCVSKAVPRDTISGVRPVVRRHFLTILSPSNAKFVDSRQEKTPVPYDSRFCPLNLHFA